MAATTPGSGTAATSPAGELTDDAVRLCRDLLRIDTSNYGPTEPGPGERVAAEYVAAELEDVGLHTTLVERDPRRTSVLARLPGADPARAPLLVHTHLDVVPARAEDWSVPPFAGEERDGYLWGRGAIDMKDMVAIALACARSYAAAGERPPRDVVFAFLADEEAGGRSGAKVVAADHPDLVADCTEAVGEVGGFSIEVPGDRRLYPIETAERGIAWLLLRATGQAGHGSFLAADSAVTRLAAAVARIGAHQFPRRVHPAAGAFLGALAEALGERFDPADPEAFLDRLGSLARVAGAALQHTANPTMLRAGYKVNVVPGEAEAQVDGRFLPGGEEEFLATIAELCGPGVSQHVTTRDIAWETTFDGPLVSAMGSALRAEDPGALPVPYLLSGGTDAKTFSTFGMRCFGFSPLRLDPRLDFFAMFHGVDERVPVEGLRFGARVFRRFLDAS